MVNYRGTVLGARKIKLGWIAPEIVPLLMKNIGVYFSLRIYRPLC